MAKKAQASAVTAHKIVSPTQWLAARKKHLLEEKRFTRIRDELSQRRRELPWEKVEENYVFDGPNGKETLSDLFAGRSQLVVYHFMFGADWKEGCPSCPFWADNFNGVIVHMNRRDVSFAAISGAPYAKLAAFHKRMGWSFKWLSSFANDFNRDYHVSFTPEEMKQGKMFYNFRVTRFPSDEAPGISVFFKENSGDIYRTYSTYGRGLDMLNTAYHYLDLVPKGRDEANLPFTQAWVQYHDKY